MKITCHSCAAKYTVSDEKVQGKTVKMKCRKCGATIVVGGAQHADASPQDEATVAAGGPDASADPPAGSFLVNVNDGDQRTMTLAEVVDAYRSGVVNADTYVWADGMTDWQPISDNAAISAALGGNGTANGNGNGGYSAPAPEPLAAAPAAAEPRAAARRDSGRRSGDLFSGGMGDGGGLSSSLSSSASAGKRDENSVLFSLSALTSTTAAPAKTSSTTATKEDSGLIDLKALAAAPAAPVASATSPMIETVGLFPLGAPVLAPPPVAAPVSIAAEPPKAKSNMTVVLILGILAVAGISTAVFFAVKSGGNPAATATVAANTTPTTPPTDNQLNPTPQPTTPTTTPTAATTDATPPASGAPSGAPTTPTKPGVPIGPGPKPTAPGTTPTTAPTPKPTTTTPKPSACPCPAGDLMCAMQKCAGKK